MSVWWWSLEAACGVSVLAGLVRGGRSERRVCVVVAFGGGSWRKSACAFGLRRT